MEEMSEHTDKEKKCLPPKITSPKRGPLLLSSLKLEPNPVTPRQDRIHCFQQSFGCRKRVREKQGYLTRYPIEKVPPHPMDVIEVELTEGITWSQLRHNIQVMLVSV